MGPGGLDVTYAAVLVEFIRKEGADMEAGRVVVGVSGSSASLAALRVAAEEARRSGRTLVAVVAWEPPEGEALYARNPDRVWARHWRDEARGRLERAFGDVFGGTPPGLAVERRVVRGRAARVLCELAAGEGDLVVVGARSARRGRVRRHVLGHAACAVMTVPAPSLPRGVRRALRRVTAADFVAVG